MTFGIVLVLFVTILGAGQKPKKPDIRLEIDAILNSKYIPKRSPGLIVTGSGSVRPYILVRLENIEYTMAYDEKTHKIKYIFTRDPNFSNKDGWQTGTYVDVTEDEVARTMHCDAFYLKGTSDGWHPVLGFDQAASRGIPNDAFKNSKTLHVVVNGFEKGGN
jgi:hypothetical protein